MSGIYDLKRTRRNQSRLDSQSCYFFIRHLRRIGHKTLQVKPVCDESWEGGAKEDPKFRMFGGNAIMGKNLDMIHFKALTNPKPYPLGLYWKRGAPEGIHLMINFQIWGTKCEFQKWNKRISEKIKYYLKINHNTLVTCTWDNELSGMM